MKNIFSETLIFWDLLTMQEQELIEQRCWEHHYKKGEMVYNTLKQLPGLKIVKEGRIRISMPMANGDILLYRFEKGRFCILGVLNQVKDLSWDIHVEAEIGTDIITIPESVYTKICHQNLALREFSQKILVERMSEIIGVIGNIAMTSVEQRVAWLLLHMWEETGRMEVMLTHEVIAKDVGTSREVVTRIMKQFEINRLVSTKRGTIAILDVQRLKSVQGGQN